MRTTMHNGRAGKNGAFKASHNDRDFDIEKAEHIDPEKVSGNWTWHCYQKQEPGMTFEAAEQQFYDRHFGQALEAKNERYRKGRHVEKVQTMEEYRRSRLGCPEEVILQIGKEGDTVQAGLLWNIAVEQVNWEQKRFPNVKVLDMALHVDEEGAPHIHQRKVWVANSKDGPIVGQEKALKEMGIEPPEPGKKTGRHNNAKMTYTRECREHFQELCKKHGLNIEIEPKEASESGLNLLEYKRRQEEKKLEEAKAERERVVADIERQKTAASDEISQKKAVFDKYIAESTKEAQNDAVAKAKEKIDAFVASRGEVLSERETSVTERENAIAEKEAELSRRESRIVRKERALSNRKKELDERAGNLDEREDGINALKADVDARLDELGTREKDFDISLNDAYWEIAGEKESLIKATEKELNERLKRYGDGDFGKDVAGLDQMLATGLSKGASL